jgi:CDGSH-type Zn-finger protein
MKVKITRNGPYVVTGRAPLAEQHICVDAEGQCHGWQEGHTYPAAEEYALCRCGRAKDKPFCDGSHSAHGQQAEFDGTETAGNTPFAEQANEIDGPDLTLLDAEKYCARARFCHRQGGTWKLTRLSDDPAAKQAAVEEAADCPGGRLVAAEKDGTTIEPALEPSIGLVEDTQAKKMGPIWVRGGIPVESCEGETYEVRNRVTLCRCGKSASKPFCDGKHLD